MKIIVSLLFVSRLLFSGCATVIKWYYDKVEIKNPPDSLEIFTKTNVRVPLQSEARNSTGSGNPYEYIPLQIDIRSQKYFLRLRSAEDQTLAFKYSGKIKMVTLHKKLGLGWVVLDNLTGGFPLFIDGYTGNWHYFDSISESFE